MAFLTGSIVYALLIILCAHVPGAYTKGRLLIPPSRSSMWRFDFPTPHNYMDDNLSCGGIPVQWGVHNGKCGLCGDPYHGPRENEAGGKYANGIITRKYQQGQVIEAYIQLTEDQKGYFEFKLCKHDHPFSSITQECLDQNLLVINSTGETKYRVPDQKSHVSDIKLKLRLPENVKCSACVLQWKYNTADKWGWNAITNETCLGCGPQEQFYGCADVAIGDYQIVTEAVAAAKNYSYPGKAVEYLLSKKVYRMGIVERDTDEDYGSDKYRYDSGSFCPVYDLMVIAMTLCTSFVI